MTENEAIKMLEIQKPVYGCKEYQKPLMHAYEMAIKALEEVQQYRAFGTPEELQRKRERSKEWAKKAQQNMLEALEELQKYNEIGTPEECRAAMEKQTAKRPRIIGNAMICPSCPRCFKSASPTYCPSCGQWIDWGNEK